MEFAEKIGDLILDDSYSSCETMNFLLYILLRFAILGSYKLTFSKIQDCRLFWFISFLFVFSKALFPP